MGCNKNLVPELATDIPTTANGGISADGLTSPGILNPACSGQMANRSLQQM